MMYGYGRQASWVQDSLVLYAITVRYSRLTVMQTVAYLVHQPLTK